MSNLLEYLFSLIYIVGLVYFVHKMMDISFKQDKNYKIVIILIYGVIHYFMNHIDAFYFVDSVSKNLVAIGVDYLFVLILLKQTKFNIISVTSIYYCTFVILTFVISNMVNVLNNFQLILYFNDLILKNIVVLMIYLVNYLMMNLVLKLQTFNQLNSTPNYYFILISSIYILFALLILPTELTPNQGISFATLTPILIGLFFMIYFILVYLITIYNQSRLYKIINLSNRMMSQYIETFNEQYQEMRALRHDFSNHLAMINELNNHENEYVVNLADKINRHLDDAYTKNIYVNACLNMKKISYPDIKFDVTSVLEEDIGIDNDDFCTLFYNLLDNAIQATLETDKRNIIIKILKKEDNILIMIRNPQDGISNFKTDKGKGHGLGMLIIRNIMDKYQGYIKYVNEAEYMEVNIRIPVSND